MAKRNKPLITVSVSPYIKEQAEELVESGGFGSMSDLVSIALAEFIGAYNRKKKEKEATAKESLSQPKEATKKGQSVVVSSRTENIEELDSEI